MKNKAAEKEWKQLRYTRDPDEMIAGVVGKEYMEYRKRWERAGRLQVTGKYPTHLDFEFRYGCNLKCPYCILQIGSSELGENHPYHIRNKSLSITFEKFEEILKEGISHGLSSITIGGNNEPLLTRDVARYIKRARELGIVDVIMLTNATLLTEKISAELLDSGITKIYFSLDAIRQETYRIVRKGGDFGKVMKNIEYFLKLKKEKGQVLPITRVSFVKNKLNEAEAEEFAEYWKTKVDFLCFQAFVTPAYGYSGYETLRKKFQMENKELKEPGVCSQPYQRLTIYSDGSVHPCCRWYGSTIILGNINSESIYDIWNSAKMKKFRLAVNDSVPDNVPKECRICRKTIFGE
ncbi:MAG: radical SAM/SPASM domain-containing protein [Candidatus Omnitrophota bacterium]|nr:radical SAM protein [Candidatus Omnitrophota bacterium]